MTRTMLVSVWVALVSVAPALPCAAQDASATESVSGDAEARARFEAGRIAYAAGRYGDALADFEHAHDLSGRPELLFNMGQCLDRLRRDAEAIDAFERYLAAVPEAGNREEVEARLAVLRASEAERVAAAVTPEPTPTPAPTPEPVRGGIETEWWLWTIVGVVVVGAAVGIGVGVATATPSTSPPIAGEVGPGGVVTALVGSW